MLDFVKFTEPRQLGSLLEPLTGLTKLELWGNDCFEIHHSLWQTCLGNLQHLVWMYATHRRAGTVRFTSSLQHLSLHLDSARSVGEKGLIEGLAGLTGLTALSLTKDFNAEGWSSDGRANEAATFLTRLNGLVHLNLDHVQHVANVEGDVACLAALTALRSLGLSTSCICHHVDPMWVREDNFNLSDNDPWKSFSCGFQEFESRGGFLPLLRLSGVEYLDVKGAWKVLMGASFRAALNLVRQDLGRPPVKFERFGLFDRE